MLCFVLHTAAPHAQTHMYTVTMCFCLNLCVCAFACARAIASCFTLCLSGSVWEPAAADEDHYSLIPYSHHLTADLPSVRQIPRPRLSYNRTHSHRHTLTYTTAPPPTHTHSNSYWKTPMPLILCICLPFYAVFLFSTDPASLKILILKETTSHSGAKKTSK